VTDGIFLGCEGKDGKRVGVAPSHNKNVSGSAHFVRSDLHGLGRMWPGNQVQRILEVTVRPRLVVGHVGNI
jgi:hypothetical protein